MFFFNKNNDKYIIVITTAKDIDESKILANSLIEKKFAACVNIIEKVLSVYMWDNKKCEDKEMILLIKTKKSLYSSVEAEIIKNHSYKNPEIICFEIKHGSKDYINWIRSQTI